MEFRIAKNAVAWFGVLQPELRSRHAAPMFDMYYFCLLAGLATGRKRSGIKADDSNELVEYFPGEYREKGRIIVALFLATELRELGVEFKDRSAVHSTIRRLVDPHSPSHLSDEGVRLMNSYAHGGYDVLTEWFSERPRVLEAFLPMLLQRLDAAQSASGV